MEVIIFFLMEFYDKIDFIIICVQITSFLNVLTISFYFKTKV